MSPQMRDFDENRGGGEENPRFLPTLSRRLQALNGSEEFVFIYENAIHLLS